ncbi:hypothetical protein SAMN05421870_114176 [Streptomyces qinglanensis]|uniref:Uncharacterized protein n=1 Tax=Streptomyces qinglanensis TaxID=943816 RepID=A0A1H9W201_9ACTN|nr:hypothetical protein SAMN05421870_114176 [Streptomyces qinglanensis]
MTELPLPAWLRQTGVQQAHARLVVRRTRRRGALSVAEVQTRRRLRYSCEVQQPHQPPPPGAAPPTPRSGRYAPHRPTHLRLRTRCCQPPVASASPGSAGSPSVSRFPTPLRPCSVVVQSFLRGDHEHVVSVPQPLDCSLVHVPHCFRREDALREDVHKTFEAAQQIFVGGSDLPSSCGYLGGAEQSNIAPGFSHSTASGLTVLEVREPHAYESFLGRVREVVLRELIARSADGTDQLPVRGFARLAALAHVFGARRDSCLLSSSPSGRDGSPDRRDRSYECSRHSCYPAIHDASVHGRARRCGPGRSSPPATCPNARPGRVQSLPELMAAMTLW